MNRLLFAPIVIVSFIILGFIAFYVNYVIIDDHDIKLYVKWIPAALLTLQSIYVTIVHKFRGDIIMAVYSVLLAIAYIVCGIGDIILVLDSNINFMIAMVIFLIGYIIIGTARIRNIIGLSHQYTFVTKKNIFTLITYLFLHIIGFGFIIYELIENKSESFNYFYPVMGILYFIAMMYAGTTHLIYLMMNRNILSAISFVGISLFIVSDFLIIVQNIRYNSLWLEIAVMIFYWLGITVLSWSVYQPEVVRFILPSFNNNEI